LKCTEPTRTLPGKLDGRPLLFDKNFYKFIQKETEGSKVASSKVVMAAACGILKAYAIERGWQTMNKMS